MDKNPLDLIHKTIPRIILIVACLLAVHDFSNAQNIYVDIKNTSGVEDGTAAHPFKSLWDGIIASKEGDTLFIRNGVYNATPTTPDFLLKDGVITRGEDSSKTIINGGFKNALASMNSYTELSNLTCGDVSVLTGNGTAKVVIRKCKLNSVRIASGSGYQYFIENCTINEGVENASGNNFLYILNNTITQGRIFDSGDGPDEIESHFVENNKIFYAGKISDDYYKSAIAAASKSITIRNNVIKATNKNSGIKVSCHPPTNVVGNIIEVDKPNDFINDDFYGIYTSSGEGIVTGNTIKGGKAGYYSKSGATLFEGNIILDSYEGFYSKGAEEVKNNQFSGNTIGMVLYGLRGPVSENIVSDNDSIGIWLLKDVDLGGGSLNGSGGISSRGTAIMI